MTLALVVVAWLALSVIVGRIVGPVLREPTSASRGSCRTS